MYVLAARDLRYELGESLRFQDFTKLVLLALALGIGSVTAMYSVIQPLVALRHD